MAWRTGRPLLDGCVVLYLEDPDYRRPDCCARAASGHAAAAPPTSVMNSRRCSGRDAIFIAPPAQNRTGGFPAYGLYGSFFVKGASRHFCRALLLHSFVRPVPRAFFHPDRTLPSPSRAAAVKDGASSAPPKACP